MIENIKHMESDRCNPVEIAAYTWLEVVKIHPFYEANKRTGRLLASIILLQHGITPPLILTKDVDVYISSLLNALITDNNQLFMDFVRAITHSQT